MLYFRNINKLEGATSNGVLEAKRLRRIEEILQLPISKTGFVPDQSSWNPFGFKTFQPFRKYHRYYSLRTAGAFPVVASGCRRCEVSRHSGLVCDVKKAILRRV